MKKNLYLFLLLVPFLTSCKKEKTPIVEVPVDIIRTDAQPTLYPNIVNIFPEHVNATIAQPALFSDTVQKRIVVKDETEVYVTFIAEKASYLNSFGYYSYEIGNEPNSAGDIKLNLVFPNVSSEDDGGQLKQGDMVQLGSKPFPKNTVIGFFLIVNGWKSGEIDYSATTHFTDYILNESSTQQHVLFKEKLNNDIILGFEDMPKTGKYIDMDYNDVILKITDNREQKVSINFEIVKLPILGSL